MNFKQIKQKTLHLLGNLLVVNLVTLVISTLKIKYKNKEAISSLAGSGKNYIIAFWHGNMLLGWYLHKTKNSAALISMSKDGALLAKLLSKWNYQVVRGSSNEGGKEALNKIVNLVLEGKIIAITPDGPKGPIHKFKAGAVVSAKKTNVPLVLAGISYEKKIILKKSWDKFEVPKLFSNAFVVYSDPIYINQSLSYEETSAKIDECEAALNTLQKEADEYFKRI